MAADMDDNKNVRKASYDDLNAVEDFLRLSKAKVMLSSENASSDSSTKQKLSHKDEASSSSIPTEECIMVPIDDYLVDDEHTDELNSNAHISSKNVTDRSRAGEHSLREPPQQSEAPVENIRVVGDIGNISINPNRPGPPTTKHSSVAEDMSTCSSIVESRLNERPRSTDHGFGNVVTSNSSDSSTLKSISSSSLNAQEGLHEPFSQDSQDKTSSQSNSLVCSPEEHSQQMVIQRISSNKDSSPGVQSNDKDSSFHRHIVRYDPQALSLKRLSSTKIASRVHEIGCVGIQSFKKFPGFKGSGKVARTPKAVDVLYVAKDTPESNGVPRSYSKAASPLTDALEMIRKEQVKAKDSQAVNRFFIGPVLSSMSVNDTTELCDYRNRNLYDTVEKKSSWGKMTTNYVKVVGSKFICYRSKSVRLTSSTVSDEYFHSPDDIYSYYPEKYALDLKESQLYVITGKPIYTLSPCRNCYSVFSKNIEEISNVEVLQITRENDAYSLCVGKDGESRYISIPNLDFVIYSSGQYHWFRCRSPSSLAKWLTIIQIRQGHEVGFQ